MPIAPDSSAAGAAHALGEALVRSAWITSRIVAGLGLATWAVGALAALAKAPVRRRHGAALVHALALVVGGALIALTRGEAERVLPAAAQAGVAAVAALLGASGGLLGAWSARALGRAAPGALVTTGPYGIVRHPLYLSLAVTACAVGLALGSLLGALVLAVALGWVSATRARAEERELARLHPEEFPAWAARVRAFTPRV